MEDNVEIMEERNENLQNPNVVETNQTSPHTYEVRQQQTNDTGNFGWAVLGFFIPLVGLILYIVWQKERPKDAKFAGIGALVGFVLGIIANIFLMPVILSFLEKFVGPMPIIRLY